ncbi:Uncharacterised protein g11247 [Pycnogonum litorale]
MAASLQKVKDECKVTDTSNTCFKEKCCNSCIPSLTSSFTYSEEPACLSVSARTAFIVHPDVAFVDLCISSSQSDLSDAKESLTRKLNYVYQTLDANGIMKDDAFVTSGLCERRVRVKSSVSNVIDFRNHIYEKMADVSCSPVEVEHSQTMLERKRTAITVEAIKYAEEKGRAILNSMGSSYYPNIRNCKSCKEDYFTETSTRAEGVGLHAKLCGTTVRMESQVTLSFQW